MTTIDSFLKEIISYSPMSQLSIPNRDKRILVSLAKQLNSGVFLTENQGNLLVKIIKENLKELKVINPLIESILDANVWSEKFRIVKKVRKIYISPENSGLITIEFTFNNKLKEKIINLNTKIKGSVISSNSKYNVQLTEKNLFTVVDTFSGDDFEIDEKIMKFYQEISEIFKNNENPFSVFEIKNENLVKIIEQDIGPITKENLLLLNDRKFRYQYTISEKIEENSLSAKIANRQKRKIFIDSKKTSLSSIVGALQELKRFPVLTIFEGHDHKINQKTLNLVNTALTDNNIFENVGIYFRFEKSLEPVNFNSEIARLGYNKILDNNTVLAGIANNKLPKFMLKSQWKPGTVISFTSAFKNSKSAVYCSDVDLIIYYGEKAPLGEDVDVLV